jgi:hydroxymethylpyrimidine/phosphomethylpyrimidine kinase
MCCWRLTFCLIDRGLEADQKVIAAHGCYAMTATTALTAQNTQGVTGIHETPSEFVKKCIDACAEDVGIDVVKTGKYISLSLLREVAHSQH